MKYKQLSAKISELKNLKDFSSKDNETYYQSIIELRNLLRNSRTKIALNNITFDSNFMLPVNIKNILNDIQALPIAKQEMIIENYFNKWKGGNEQIDDVLFIGLKL